MDQEKGMNDPAVGTIDVTKKKNLSQDKAEGLELEKCLEENKGDYTKCKGKVEAFKSSSSPPATKPLTPIRLRSGSLIDV